MRISTLSPFSLAACLGACSLVFDAPTDSGGNGGPGDDGGSDEAADAAGTRPSCDSVPTPTHCLQDDFSFVDSETWEVFRTNDGNGVQIEGHELRLGMSAQGGDRALIGTKNTHSLRESEIVVHVVRTPDPRYTDVWAVVSLFGPGLDDSQGVEIGCTEGELVASASRIDGAGWEVLGIPALCTHAEEQYWRIHHTAGTIFFSYGSELGVWTPLTQISDNQLNVDETIVTIHLDNYNPGFFSGPDNNFVITAVNP